MKKFGQHDNEYDYETDYAHHDFERALEDYYNDYIKDAIWGDLDEERRKLKKEFKAYQEEEAEHLGIPPNEVEMQYFLKQKFKLVEDKMREIENKINKSAEKKKDKDPNHQYSRKTFFNNYDLYGKKDGDKTSPGTGFFQHMNEYKSVKDFIDQSRKRKNHTEKLTTAARINLLRKIAKLLNDT